MKTLLTLALISTFCLTGCIADGQQYGYNYSTTSYGYAPTYRPTTVYQSAPVYRPAPPVVYFSNSPLHNPRVPSVTTVYGGYSNNDCGVRYKNYTDSSIIVRHRNGSATVVARSWD